LQTDKRRLADHASVFIQNRLAAGFGGAGLLKEAWCADLFGHQLDDRLRQIEALREHADQRRGDEQQHQEDGWTNKGGEGAELHAISLLSVLPIAPRCGPEPTGGPVPAVLGPKILGTKESWSLENPCFFGGRQVFRFHRFERFFG
jgi:hypothetical protein